MTVKETFGRMSFIDGADINFNFINEGRCINLIGNPEQRSESFNCQQIASMLKEFGNKVVCSWNISTGSFGTIEINIITR